MAEPLRHRQTKEAATDMFSLQPPRYIPTLPESETAATGRRVRLLGYCCHQRDMRRRDLRMLRCRYHETKRLSDPRDDAWQTCTGMGVRSLAVACGGAQHD